MTEGRGGRGQGFWLTAGEVVGALALIVAGLNLWESHQQREDTAHRVITEERARTAFVAEGRTERQGRSLLINPLSSAQAITSERYLFPHEVQPSVEDVSAAQPRIDEGWIAPGLARNLEKGRLKGSGHGRLPVIIETTYVEDGETRLDISLYDLGYDWKPRFLGGEQIRLTGLALVRRAVTGDERRLVDSTWTARLPAKVS